jgi:regulation of enolase protein 1 (concanavalin A-like superfamily)
MGTAAAILFGVMALATVEGAGAPSVSVPGIPGPFEWKNTPVSWKSGASGLTIVSGKKTDWYISPIDGQMSASAPLLLFKPDDDFILSTKVSVDFRSQWDAGFLMVYVDDKTWAKFALEMSAYKEPTIVTVVTREVSDDCNSTPIAGSSIYLQIAKSGPALIFYASPDGRSWKLVRAFTLGSPRGLRVGFASQAPTGESGTAEFSEIKYRAAKVKDIFAGE